MFKIATIVGARPQFIKAAAISRQIKKHYPGIQEILVHTGQHYDRNMSEIFFEELDLNAPDYNLQIGSDLHGAQTAKMLASIEQVLIKEQPNLVLLYGDTNSTLAGSLAAVKLHIPIAHVEAGLRSFNKHIPEEVNRIVADHMADFLFAPTVTSFKQLEKEGISLEKIFLSGDVMYDNALYYRSKALEKSKILEKLQVLPKKYILLTLHRADKTNQISRLKIIVEAICDLSKSHHIVFPVHPGTKHQLEKHDLLNVLLKAKVSIIEPLGFLDMLQLEQHASLIITDSGGVQKEAFFYRVPCVVLQEETPWVELVELGWNYLASPIEKENILNIVSIAMNSNPKEAVSPYGEGDAAEKIMQVLSKQMV